MQPCQFSECPVALLHRVTKKGFNKWKSDHPHPLITSKFSILVSKALWGGAVWLCNSFPVPFIMHMSSVMLRLLFLKHAKLISFSWYSQSSDKFLFKVNGWKNGFYIGIFISIAHYISFFPRQASACHSAPLWGNHPWTSPSLSSHSFPIAENCFFCCWCFPSLPPGLT